MQWQKQLYQYEETPPEEMWAKLQQEIENEPLRLRAALSDMESTPPGNTWENISKKLLPEPSVSSEPIIIRRRYTHVLSYAAAVAGAILIISGLIFLLKNQGKELNSSEFTTSITVPDSQNKKNTAAGDLSLSSPEVVNGGMKILYSDGNYIQISTPGGDYQRVSYKFYDMIQVMYGPEAQNKFSPESKAYWQHTVSDWKEKMGHSAYVPSGSNFFDLAEMLTMLEENQ